MRLRVASRLYLAFLLRLEEVSHAHSDGADGLRDAGREDGAPADRRDRRERPCRNEYCAQCRHRAWVLRAEEIQGLARIHKPCRRIRNRGDGWTEGISRLASALG